MVFLGGGGGVFIMSEVPLYVSGPISPEAGIQGYLAHKKTPPP